MKKKMLKKFLFLSAFGLILTVDCVYTIPPPPPPQVSVIPARPHRDAVWVEGYWRYGRWHHRYVWVPGHWKVQRRGVWVIIR